VEVALVGIQAMAGPRLLGQEVEAEAETIMLPAIINIMEVAV
jgi:hypothetical protein